MSSSFVYLPASVFETAQFPHSLSCKVSSDRVHPSNQVCPCPFSLFATHTLKVEKNWLVAQGEARELHALVGHADTILTQGKDKKSEWGWAATFLPNLEAAHNASKNTYTVSKTKVYQRPLTAAPSKFKHIDTPLTPCQL
jgi:hypothetical protein